MNPRDLFPLAEAADRLPRRPDGRKVGFSTLWRWVTRGLGGAVLQTTVTGARRWTSVEWLEDFRRALARQRGGCPQEELPV